MEDPIREGVDILVEVLVILAVGVQGKQLLSQMEETRTRDPTLKWIFHGMSMISYYCVFLVVTQQIPPKSDYGSKHVAVLIHSDLAANLQGLPSSDQAPCQAVLQGFKVMITTGWRICI